jgi:hypothetical protein
VRGAVGQPDLGQPFARAGQSLTGGTTRIVERKLDVLERAGASQEIELLEDEADPGIADAGELIAR